MNRRGIPLLFVSVCVLAAGCLHGRITYAGAEPPALVLVRSTPVKPIAAATALSVATGHLFVGSWLVVGYGSGQGDSSRTPRGTPLGYVSMLDTRTGRTLRVVRVGQSPAAMAADDYSGHIFVLDRLDGNIRILDARSGALVTTVYLHSRTHALGAIFPGLLAVDTARGRVIAVAPGAANRMAARAVTASEVTVLDSRTGAVRARANGGINPTAIVVDQAAGRVVVVSAGPLTASAYYPYFGDRGQARVIDLATGQVLRTLAVDPGPSAAALEGPAGRVYIVTRGHAMFVDPTTGLDLDGHKLSPGYLDSIDDRQLAPVGRVKVGLYPDAIDIDSASGRGVVLNAASASMTVFNSHTGAVITTVPATAMPLAVRLINEASAVLIVVGLTTMSGQHEGLSLVETCTGRIVGHVDVHGPQSMSYDPKDGRAYVIHDDRAMGNMIRTVAISRRPGQRCAATG